MRGKPFYVTHGLSGTPTHESWRAMKERCTNTRNVGFHNYGGRGITVCKRWRLFVNFLAAMGERPSTAHSIERIDNASGYKPGNCRWATDSEQASNKRNNHTLTIDGVSKHITAWARESPVTAGAILFRVRHGWSDSDAVRLPRGAKGTGKFHRASSA